MKVGLGRLSFLIVDQTGHIAAIEAALLKAYGVEKITVLREPAKLLATMRDRAPDVLIVNWVSIDENWTSLMTAVRDEIRSPDPFMHIMFVSPAPSHRRIKTAISLGVDTIISVPLRAETFYGHLRRLVETERVFVRASSYFGPDRRRRKSAVLISERRGKLAANAASIEAAEVKNWRGAQREIARSADLITAR